MRGLKYLTYVGETIGHSYQFPEFWGFKEIQSLMDKRCGFDQMSYKFVFGYHNFSGRIRKEVLKIILTLLIGVTLIGCPSTNSKYLTRPATIEVAGTYTHSPSGTMFPLTVGEFKRRSIARFDEQGFDVSVGYDLYEISKSLSATVYVYPSPSILSIGSPPDVIETARAVLCKNEFEARKQEIIGAHPGAKLLKEGDGISPEKIGVVVGQSAIFEFEGIFAGVRQPLKSRLNLLCYIGGEWTIKYRFTYPSNFDAEQNLDGFIQRLPWERFSSRD